MVTPERGWPSPSCGRFELPLFPLGTVLFPGALLPLHIFEARYREMIGRCLASIPRQFGVMLIAEGDEVVEPTTPGGPPGRAAQPHATGTIARIVESQQEPDGRYFLICVGEQRIRLRRLLQEQPYLIGEVETLHDEDTEKSGDTVELAERLRAAARRLLETLAAAVPPEREAQRRQLRTLSDAVPASGSDLSFFVPRLLSAATNEERQRLLSLTSLGERLRAELPLLVREQQIVRQLQQLGPRPSLN
jgi:Lon protease-like protein